MKLIIQADDYGISEGVIYGVMKAVNQGCLTSVGMFSNMPTSPLAAALIKDKEICLGQDINICTGPCVAAPEKIPTIARPDGILYTKNEHIALDQKASNGDHMRYEECCIEVRAQIERFKELVGRYPAYLNGHSYHNRNIDQAVKDLSKEYQIPMAKELEYKYQMASPKKLWYKRPFPLEEQIRAYAMDSILADKDFIKQEYGILIFHCGYIDPDLLEVSTFSVIRVNDLKAVLSMEMKQWISDNGIEKISYSNLM